MKNTLFGTHPVILHCPSSEVKHHLWDRATQLMQRKNTNYKTNISIVTWNNQPKKGWFELSLNNLPHTILGKDIYPWTNRHKIKLTKDFLTNCKSEYVLGVDSFDAILIGDPNKTINDYMTFNATIMSWPNIQKFSDYEKSITTGPFCHMNAGVWAGKTTFCREFFDYAANYEDHETKKYPESEQVVLRAILPKFPNVKIDSKCEIFQTIEFPHLYPLEHQKTQYVELERLLLY